MESKHGFFNFSPYQVYYETKTFSTNRSGILFIHGKGSHSGYYTRIFDETLPVNYYLLDLPGFGKSSGIRGHINSFQTYFQIIDYYLTHFIEKDQLDHLFICGESMGSIIAYYISLNLTIRGLKGLIFLPAVLQIEELNHKKNRLLLNLINLIHPSFSFKGKRPIDTYTSNKEYQKIAENDPLWERNKTARLILELDRYLKYLHQTIDQNKIPILMFIPEQDYYTKISSAYDFFNKIPYYPENQLIILKNSKHWIIIDNEIELIKKSMYEWIIKLSSS